MPENLLSPPMLLSSKGGSMFCTILSVKMEKTHIDLFDRIVDHIVHIIRSSGAISYHRINLSHAPKQ